MTPAAVICSAIGGRNREDRTADVLNALMQQGWAFIKVSEASALSGEGIPNVWRPIAEADSEIATILELGEMTLRNSLPIWARDSDGRVFQAVWTDHKNGYWWDIDGECRADPVEFYPHPLDVRR